jgi:hypothetical protein
MMHWFLILSFPLSGGIDCGIIPNGCPMPEQHRIEMQSEEACMAIKDALKEHIDATCLGEIRK